MIHHGDLFDVLPLMDAESIDACVTDPPYGIGFMGKEWDSFKPGEEAKRIVVNHAIESDNPNLKGRTRSPASSPSAVEYDRGLAGQRAFQEWCEKWAREVYRVLKPGGYLLVCGAPRSFHRMTCGVEDTGFDVRDCLSWLYGSGFPKSLNVAKAIDAKITTGRSRPEDMRREAMGDDYEPSGRGRVNYDHGGGSVMNGSEAGDPTTAEGKLWVGWGTALKPGWEPIVVFRKPLKGTVADNVLTYGTGGINVDGCRIHGVPEPTRFDPAKHGHEGWRMDATGEEVAANASPLGRWPANVVLDEAAAAMLDQQTGELGESYGIGRFASPESQGYGGGWSNPKDGDVIGFGDTGGASRFYYVAKPSREERDYGCGHLPRKTGGEATDREDGSAGVNNPRAGAGRTGGGRNFHPTVKPVELMRWLVKLVTPVGGTVLDPFMGSGTTGMACRYEQRTFIGVEREADYVKIAEARISAVAPLFG